jgi:hypothetical protein
MIGNAHPLLQPLDATASAMGEIVFGLFLGFDCSAETHQQRQRCCRGLIALENDSGISSLVILFFIVGLIERRISWVV